MKLKTDGQTVDSSRERCQVFVYKVGQGQVIKGWDLAVCSMRKGEHARFTIAPPLAFGDEGSSDLGVPAGFSVVLELELLKCPARQDLFEDGGAVLLEVKDAASGRQPRASDEVQITYKVVVRGEGVAMAQQHVVYKLGSERLGRLAQVMDQALLTMKRGDEVIVTCQPDYAFGSGEGQYAKKVCSISIALEEIFEVHDMSLGLLDKTVLRKRIKEGAGTDRIHDGATVQIRVVSVSANDEKVLSEQCELSFKAGHGEVCDAIEGSVIGMRKGDEAALRCESAEACAGGLLGLANGLQTPIMIHIAVLSFEQVKDKWDLSSGERLEQGRERKGIAGELFKKGRIRLAAKHYETIADLFARLDFFQEDEQLAAAELWRVASLNKAMCMLKMGQMKVVKELCTSVLKQDTSNPKALFRRAKAAVELKEYTEAIADLERLLEVEPASQDGRALLREAKRLRKHNDGQQSSTYARMCAGLGSLPERTDRRDDDLVVMPDLDKEMLKIAEEHGLPIRMPQRSGSSGGAVTVAGGEVQSALSAAQDPESERPPEAEEV